MSDLQPTQIRAIYGREPFLYPFGQIVFFGESPSRAPLLMQPTWIEHPANEMTPISCRLGIHDGVAEDLMGQLWSAGDRPRHGAGTVAHADALNQQIEHLEAEILWLRQLAVKAPRK